MPANAPLDAAFPVTHWTLVHAAQGEDAEDAERAMEDLCNGYWYPIYAFLRRSGRSAPDAEDLTQEFFQELVAGDALHSARRDAGKLRSYLLAILKRQLSDQIRHDSAQKRGGTKTHVSFDALAASERYELELEEHDDPDSLYTHAWAQDLLAGVREKLRAAYQVVGREGVFDILLPFLMWDNEPPSHREIANQIGSSEAGSRIVIHRLRTKFRELLKNEVGLTVRTPDEIPEELAWLQSVLVGK